ncbi:hypothetical protein STENM223S_03139 [Streptomyces tendae]
MARDREMAGPGTAAVREAPLCEGTPGFRGPPAG